MTNGVDSDGSLTIFDPQNSRGEISTIPAYEVRYVKKVLDRINVSINKPSCFKVSQIEIAGKEIRQQ